MSLAANPSVSTGRDWSRLLAGVERGTLLVVGRPGSGRTTLARWLVGQLARDLERVALVDCDPAQGTVGVPGCLGLALTGPWEAPAASWFVGATSPDRHPLPIVVGAQRLTELARARGAQAVVLDPPALLEGPIARALIHHLAAATGVDQVIAIGGDTASDEELEDLLALLAAPDRRLTRPAPASDARKPSADGGRQHREARFAAHFAGARTRLFAPRRLIGPDWRLGGDPPALGTVLGLLDGDGLCLGLGVLEEIHEDRLAVATPVADVPVVRLIVGELRLDRDRRELAPAGS